ncbi:MAG: DUF5615 family PIN-like protein [Alphaproteobacteria bacterium]|nr:DUF5615 family PIN-like protein [Alphaproteobacteria bacterium]
MRFLIDECLPRMLAQELINRGHDCELVVNSCPTAPDEEVLAIAKLSGRILMSEDRDFGSLVFRDGNTAIAIVAIYFKKYELPFEETISTVVDQIEALESDIEGQFVVIEPGKARLRKLPPRT